MQIRTINLANTTQKYAKLFFYGKIWWDVRPFGEWNEELYVDGTNVLWSKVSDESLRFPILSLTMETPVVSAHWTSFHLPSNHVDQFEVSGIICLFDCGVRLKIIYFIF